MIIGKNLSLAFLHQQLFDNLNFAISYTSKVGVLGRNGSGKSTLFKVLAKEQKLDGGTITYNPQKIIGYLPQELILSSDKSIFDEAFDVFNITNLKKELLNIEQQLISQSDNNKALQLTSRYSLLQEQLSERDEACAVKKTEKILHGLGFKESQFNQKVQHLSTGWKMRIALAKLLLQEADFYLFDEPTNHLDLPTKQWFLSFLQQASFGYLLITHDKFFLEKACDKILEITCGKATLFDGNFQFYLQQKEKMQEILLAKHTQQEKELAQKKRTIERFRAKPSKARLAKSMEKKLEKIERVTIEPPLPLVSFSFNDVVRSGKIVVDIDNVTFKYTQHNLLTNVSGNIIRDKKVALVAPNGTGKSTLLNLIAGSLPLQSGTITIGYNVSVGYFEQDQTRVLKKDNTILQEIIDAHPQVPESKIRSFLGSFLFSSDEVNKYIHQLSGGEKNRVAMVKILLGNYNFLVLDEPTNHLDLYAKEVLLQALQQYKGTILFVSHDLDFVQQVADTILELTPSGTLYMHDGDYASYCYFKNQQLETHAQKEKLVEKITYESKANNKKQHEQKKQLRVIESKIEKLEVALQRLSEQLSSDYQQDILIQIESVDKELQKAYKQWELLSATI